MSTTIEINYPENYTELEAGMKDSVPVQEVHRQLAEKRVLSNDFVINADTTIPFGKLAGEPHSTLLLDENLEYSNWILNSKSFKYEKSKKWLENEIITRGIDLTKLETKKEFEVSSFTPILFGKHKGLPHFMLFSKKYENYRNWLLKGTDKDSAFKKTREYLNKNLPLLPEEVEHLTLQNITPEEFIQFYENK